MSAIIDFQLCQGSTDELPKKVRESLKDGWLPHGGLVAMNGQLIQAMVMVKHGASADGDIELVPRKPGPAEEAL